MTARGILTALLVAVVGTTASPATQEMPLAPAFAAGVSSPPPLRLAAKPGGVPLAALPPALEGALDELAEVISWNDSGRLPVRNGLQRSLAPAHRVELDARSWELSPPREGRVAKTAAGSRVWGAAVRVEGASRLRLHLREVNLPAGARLWVYSGAGEAVGPFGRELVGPGRELWTPSVAGPVIHLEVELPAGWSGRAGFAVAGVLEMVGEGPALAAREALGLAPRLGECLLDARCIGSGIFSVIDLAEHGVAHIQFVDGSFSYVCSGGLLNSASLSNYFLTANHCFDDQAAASTLEAFWDFFTPYCNGPAPSLGSLPRSNGSTLVETGASSDFTMVRLSSIPAGRIYLGWNANLSAAVDGTVLNRLSHPVHPSTFQLLPQRYSRNHVDATALTCIGAPRPQFLYETYQTGLGDLGGTFGGSSGAPAILDNGQVVGQLTGGCGPNPSDGCDYSNAEVDGAFSESFDQLGPHLNRDVIFSDGFESGDTSAWSATVP